MDKKLVRRTAIRVTLAMLFFYIAVISYLHYKKSTDISVSDFAQLGLIVLPFLGFATFYIILFAEYINAKPGTPYRALFKIGIRLMLKSAIIVTIGVMLFAGYRLFVIGVLTINFVSLLGFLLIGTLTAFLLVFCHLVLILLMLIGFEWVSNQIRKKLRPI